MKSKLQAVNQSYLRRFTGLLSFLEKNVKYSIMQEERKCTFEPICPLSVMLFHGRLLLHSGPLFPLIQPQHQKLLISPMM